MSIRAPSPTKGKAHAIACIKAKHASRFQQLRFEGDSKLLQFIVLGLGLLQCGEVGVGVFPEREEILSYIRFFHENFRLYQADMWEEAESASLHGKNALRSSPIPASRW